MKKILLVLTSHDRLGDTGRKTGAYLSEVAHPHHVFTRAGFAVDFVSPRGGQPPLDGTRPAAEVDPAGYDAIVYAGGHGTMWDFPDDAALARLASAIYQRGGVV